MIADPNKLPLLKEDRNGRDVWVAAQDFELATHDGELLSFRKGDWWGHIGDDD